MNNEILVMFTMDVEPVTTDNTRVSGPKSNKEGEICVKNYISAIGEYGYTPTFFIHPELGKVQSDFFLELQSKGACLGLHLHTTKFIKKKYDCEMGGLSGEQQREILEIAIELYKRDILASGQNSSVPAYFLLMIILTNCCMN